MVLSERIEKIRAAHRSELRELDQRSEFNWDRSSRVIAVVAEKFFPVFGRGSEPLPRSLEAYVACYNWMWGARGGSDSVCYR